MLTKTLERKLSQMTFVEFFCLAVLLVCAVGVFIMAAVVLSVEAIKAKRRAVEAAKEQQESAALWRIVEKEKRNVGFIADKEP